MNKLPLRRILAAVLILLALQPVLLCTADDELLLTEIVFSKEESISRWIDVPGRGLTRYYAQNEPLWGSLIYESAGVSSKRPIRDGGCCPTALAIALRALVPEEELPMLEKAASVPFSLCICSLNRASCDAHHERYILTSPRDYERFLPLALADFAAGNNRAKVQSRSAARGTASGFIRYAADAYGIETVFTLDRDEALRALDEGKSVVALAGHDGAFTNVGHYVFIASRDDERIYFLDPLCRTEYKTNFAKVITIIEPGLVSIEMKDLRYAYLNSYIIFSTGQ